MTAQATSMLGSPSGKAVKIKFSYPAGELAALHEHLVLEFRSMVDEHLPGSAFVAPYPSARDVWPNEILVIPARSGAASFSIGFPQDGGTTMIVRIGEHGVVDSSEDGQTPRSLAATAEALFTIALSGRYREEIWTDTRTRRYAGGQSYFLEGQQWRELGTRRQPAASSRLSWHRFAVQDRRYEPY